MTDLILIGLAVGAYLLSLRFAYWWGWQEGSDDAYFIAERQFVASLHEADDEFRNGETMSPAELRAELEL